MVGNTRKKNRSEFTVNKSAKSYSFNEITHHCVLLSTVQFLALKNVSPLSSFKICGSFRSILCHTVDHHKNPILYTY